MKKFTCIVLLVFLVFSTSPIQSQTLIAVQNSTSSSFYASLDSAIVHAVAGDFIYLPGGNFTISKPINKKLQIIGVGHNPDSCVSTRITQVTGEFTINSGSDHGSITGIKIPGSISLNSIIYYSIERCNLNSISIATNSTNILVNECVIHGSISGSESLGFQLTKCIVDGSSVYGFIAKTYIINNIFMSPLYLGAAWESKHRIQGCFFKNNIFLSTVTYNSSSTIDNLFQNNLFNSGITLTSSNGTLHNNIVGPVTDLFKNKTKALFDYDQDYHILTTSPAHNAGTDKTDLGIYGTASPWKEGSVPDNPHIQKLIPQSVSTAAGNLDVKIKVAAQDF